MSTHLEQITSRTLARVLERKALTSVTELERQAADHRPRGFAAGLRRASAWGPAVIAEMKRASPSKGVLREHYRPAEIAQQYAEAGAAALSVLTDEDYFGGSLADLRSASATVAVPVLRKDFIVDSYQIVEARAAGADAILLIVASHSDADLTELSGAAREMELDVLCEVHDAEELRRAVDLGFSTIGVNCRNLKTLEVNTAVHEDLVGKLPETVLRVAESGIRSADDVRRLTGAGYQAFLVGEALMREANPGEQLAELMGRGAALRT